MTAQRLPAFRGRTSERDTLDRLLDSVRAGRSAILVIRGEPGVGKTALLRYTARQASGIRVAQLAGAESEMELPFAGLHQLCSPLLGPLDALPAPQQDALRVALGLVDAREQLRAAHEALVSIGADGFAGRTRHELLATGEKVRKRREETRDALTPQELHIAGLARDGRTNPEIGAELFISPRTVEWHLRKVFAKLGITSRMGLHDAMPSGDAEPAPA